MGGDHRYVVGVDKIAEEFVDESVWDLVGDFFRCLVLFDGI